MKLFIYDHCPYCVKARIIFGLYNLDFDLMTLLNDDEKTPIDMIGQKMVPILQKDDGSFMAESLDIIDYVDNNYGNGNLVRDKLNPDIANWLSQSSQYSNKLSMPRWAQSDLEEFQTQGAIDYFTDKKEGYIGPFVDNLKNSAELIMLANQDLLKLDVILKDHPYPNQNNQITFDDIHLFTKIRSLSIVKGLQYPKNVEQYRQKMAKLSKVPLHDDMAF